MLIFRGVLFTFGKEGKLQENKQKEEKQKEKEQCRKGTLLSNANTPLGLRSRPRADFDPIFGSFKNS